MWHRHSLKDRSKSYMKTKRLLIYASGMIILAFGLTLNTKATLGVSSILAPPYAISQICSRNLSNLVFIWYCLFVLIQLVINFFVLHERNRNVYIADILQIVISLLFTRVMDLISSIIPVFETECRGFPASMPFRLIMLILAVIMTGIGAAMTLRMNLIPNPGDGVVSTIARAVNIPVGTCKNIVDITCVFLTAALSLLLEGKIIGIGIGTLIAMLGVGRVMNLVNRIADSGHQSL